MRKFFLLFLLSFVFIGQAFAQTTLKKYLHKAKAGDFIVTSQGNSYSVLLVRSLQKEKLTLEEVSIDHKNIDIKKISWKKWIEGKAPGASSWTSIVIDLEKNTIAQCYSYFQNQWLFIEKSDYLFDKLFSLPFSPTKDTERKKIGPSPLSGEIDRRKLWKPQLVRDGKAVSKPEYEVLRGSWPADSTRLAGCVIELYLDIDNPDFPFPYWLEIQSPHYTFKIRAIDSGTGVTSPMKPLS